MIGPINADRQITKKGTEQARPVVVRVRSADDGVARIITVVVLIGPKGFLVGTDMVSRNHFGSIPFTGACGLRDIAIHDQRMAVLNEHMAPVTGSAGKVGLVAEPLSAEDAFGRFLPSLATSNPSPGAAGGGGG